MNHHILKRCAMGALGALLALYASMASAAMVSFVDIDFRDGEVTFSQAGGWQSSLMKSNEGGGEGLYGRR